LLLFFRSAAKNETVSFGNPPDATGGDITSIRNSGT
jgi:hypothetical protein